MKAFLSCYHGYRTKNLSKILAITLSFKCIYKKKSIIIFLVYGEIHRNKEKESGLNYFDMYIYMKHQRKVPEL